MSENKIKISTPSEKQKQINFSDTELLTIGVKVKDNIIRSSDCYCTQNITANTIYYPLNMDYLDDCLYIYDVDGLIHRIKEGRCKQFSLASVQSNSSFVKILYEGKEKIMTIGGYMSVILGEGVEEDVYIENLPSCEFAKVHEGVLFIAKDRNVYFSNEHDYLQFNTSLEFPNVLTLNSSAGKVCGICEVCGELFIVAEHKIYALKAYGEHHEYQLKQVKTPYLNIDKKTVKSNDHSICFVSDNKVCSFDGRSIRQYDTYLDTNLLTLNGKVTIDAKRYVLQVSIKGRQGEFALIVEQDGSQYITQINNLILCDGGYAISKISYEIYKIGPSQEKQDFFIKLNPILLDDAQDKHVTSFKIWSSDNAVLKLSNEGVGANFSLISGCNHRRINDRVGKLEVEISGQAQNFHMQDFSVNYTTRRN